MASRLGVLGALGAWAAVLGGILLAFSDAVGSPALAVVGLVLFAAGVLVFFVAAAIRSRRDGLGVQAALVQSAKDALRIAWYVFKSA